MWKSFHKSFVIRLSLQKLKPKNTLKYNNDSRIEFHLEFKICLITHLSQKCLTESSLGFFPHAQTYFLLLLLHQSKHWFTVKTK